MIPVLGDIIHEVGEVVQKFVPDADKKMEIQLALAQLADQAAARENELLSGQIEVDKAEAGSGNLFVAGWRPAIGWVSAASLGYTWLVAPLSKALMHLQELPAIPTDQIYPIVLAMLGVAGMRTYEKVQGVAASLPGNTPNQPAGVSLVPTSTESVVTSISSKLGKWFK